MYKPDKEYFKFCAYLKGSVFVIVRTKRRHTVFLVLSVFVLGTVKSDHV